MLGPPTSFSSERENEFIKKSTLLIQFLIESCCGMFGGNSLPPLGSLQSDMPLQTEPATPLVPR